MRIENGNLNVNGTTKINQLFDYVNSSGLTGQVLTSVPSGVQWNSVDAVISGSTTGKLNVSDFSVFTASTLPSTYFRQSGNTFGTTAILGTNDSQGLSLITSGQSRLFVTNVGNVGIGTTSPSYRLDVSGSGRFTEDLNITKSYNLKWGTNQQINVTDYPSYLSSGYNIMSFISSSDGVFADNASFVWRNAGISTNLMVLNGVGRLGLGMSFPTSRLQVRGIGATSSTTALLVETSGGTASLQLTDDGAIKFFDTNSAVAGTNYASFIPKYSSNNIALGFYEGSSGPALRLVIYRDNSNNVYLTTIGGNVLTANPSSATFPGSLGVGMSSPTARLQVKGAGATSSTTGLRVENSNSTPSLVVRDDGNVGVGISDPSAQLHISGSSSSLLQVGSPSNSNLLIISGSNNIGIAMPPVSTSTLSVRAVTSAGGNYSQRWFESDGVTEVARVRNSNSVGFEVNRLGTIGTSNLTIVGNPGIIINHSNGNGGSITLGDATSPDFTVPLGSGNRTGVQISRPFNLISGSTDNNLRGLLINNVVNSTGSTNTTYRALHITPTVHPSVSLYNSIETGSGNVIFNGGNVGIGVQIPTAELHISGTSSSNPLLINTSGGTTGLILNNNGFVGVGKSNPAYALDVQGSMRTNGNGLNTYYFLNSDADNRDAQILIGNTAGRAIIGLRANSNNLFIKSSNGGAPDSIVVDYNNGNVGINTPSPNASLHITGVSNSALFEIDSPTVNNILFVSGSGRVGIGTGTPTQALDVSSNIRAFSTSAEWLLTPSSTYSSIGGSSQSASGALIVNPQTDFAQSYAGTTIPVGTTLGAFGGGQYLNIGSFNSSGGGVRYFSSLNGAAHSHTWYHNKTTQLMSLSYRGNLEIGGSTIDLNMGRLFVRGVGATSSTTGLRVENSNSLSSFVVRDDRTIGVGIDNPTAQFHISGNTSSNPLLINTSGGTVALSVNNIGNVGVGTTTPTAKLQVRGAGDSSIWITSEDFNADTNTGTVVRLGTTNSTGNSNGTIDVLNSGLSSYGNLSLVRLGGNVGIGTATPAFLLDVNGTARATTLLETSSERYKTNIIPLPSQLDTINKLNPVTFNWKDETKGNGTQYGLIAEEVLNIIPDAVDINNDGTAEAISYTKLVPILIKAVQELQIEVNELKQKLNK